MSTFVVRFLGAESGGCAGTVRHVATGEESTFSTLSELLAFFEERVPIAGAIPPLGRSRPRETELRRHPEGRKRPK